MKSEVGGSEVLEMPIEGRRPLYYRGELRPIWWMIRGRRGTSVDSICPTR